MLTHLIRSTRAIALSLALLSLGVTLPALADTGSEVAAIKDNPEMLWGIGIADDRAEAVDNALAELVRKISVTVSAETSRSVNESYGTDGLRSESEYKSLVRSYANLTTLRDVRQIWISDHAPYEVMAYMTDKQVKEMYQHRRERVAEFARMAVTAEKSGLVDDALRYFYRSFVVLRSLPEYESIHEVVDGHSRHLVTWIPEQMRDICSRISFGIAGIHDADPDDPEAGRIVDLTVRYKGENASRVAFTYFNGRSKSPVITARDGIAQLLIAPYTPLSPLNVDIEYRFPDENHLIQEYTPLLENFTGAGLVPTAKIAITENPKQLKADKKEAKAFQESVARGAKASLTPLAADSTAGYARSMETLISAISTRDYDRALPLFTEDGAKMFDALIRYGNARIIGNARRDTYEFFPVGNRTVCRSVPMSFTFEEGRRKFVEDVTFTFDSEGKIESLAFALESKARDDIFAMNGSAWNDYVKMVIVGFLENYKTAFALHRLDYIESIFADNAVIIVGHVTRKATLDRSGDHRGFSNASHVTYAKKTKREYMETLRRCFASNQYINIRFGATDVGKSAYGSKTFGIQLQQEYVSSTYGDTGYLYLLVDFENADEPTIHVRTWQPERNPDLTPNIPRDSPQFGIFSNSYWE
ncbi:MAG: LPP20 family lipoprotein [Muribaculaceae bacterium]|nr:LPP20 family lipoprotein [Muribaculaceae bacterium]